MYAYYLQRGHSLRQLLRLTVAERLFYQAAMEAELELWGEMHGEEY